MLPDSVDNNSSQLEAAASSEENLLESGENGATLSRAALGVALYSAGAAWDTFNSAFRLTGSLASWFFSPVKRAYNSAPLEPVHSQFDKLVARGETEVDGWIQTGLAQEPRVRETVEKALDPMVDVVVDYLSHHPAIQKLIKDQIDQLARESHELPQINVLVRVLADNYITYLNENPEMVKALVQNQADVYIDHLQENPKEVQELVQGQSLSMAGEINDQIRERMVTGDSILEALVRRLFRRQPRTELPEPPAEVQKRALQARLPEDFPRLEAMTHKEQAQPPEDFPRLEVMTHEE